MYTKDEIEVKLEYLESIFEKYGAVPLNINEKNMEKFHQRKIYQYKDNYYRVDSADFEDNGEIFLVLSSTDEKKYADIGLLEDIDAFSAGMSDEQLEKQVRYALGIEPYPEDYAQK